MAENPKFNNSDMFTDASEDYSEITTDNKSEVLATQGNVINSIRVFWNKLRTKLAYAISRPNYSKQVGGSYVPIFVDTDGVVQECRPTTIQASIAQNGIITIPINYIPNDNIYTGTTVCISVLNNSASGSSSNLQIQHNSFTSSVKYPSGVTVQAKGISKGDLLLATFCKNSNSSSNNFWILLNKINTVVSTGQTTSNGSSNGGHPGLMTAEDKAKLETIDWSANNYILPKATDNSLGGIQLGYTTNDRKYKLETDNNGNGYVNVPWTDTTYSLPTASSSEKGGVKLGANKLSNLDTPKSTNNTDRYYPIQTDKNDKLVVNVPWTDTQYTLPTANGNTLGGVKSATTGTTPYRDYNVEVKSDGTMKVNVPWTDTNTHNTAYLRAGNNTSTSNESAGNGDMYLKIVDGGSRTSSLNISGTGGTSVTSDADGNIFINSPLYPALTSSNSMYGVYVIKGPGVGKSNTKYYLAGDGTWVNGILVPVPQSSGDFTLKCKNGVLSWE